MSCLTIAIWQSIRKLGARANGETLFQTPERETFWGFISGPFDLKQAERNNQIQVLVTPH